MLKGTVKFFQKAKGFGFITPDQGGNEVFLPAAAIAAADMPRLKPGQRVTFEQAPDARGPKVVSLKLVEEAPRPVAAHAPAHGKLTVFYDPASAASDEVLQELGALGHQLQLVDVMTAPPTPEDLRKLSLMLGGSKLGLVRRYDPLFLALQLDDRFITEGEFWTAISQHPALINGPILAMGNRAGACKTRDDVRAFFAPNQPEEEKKPKAISARLAALMSGQPLPPPPPAPVREEKPAAQVKARAEAAPAKAKPAPKEKTPEAKAAKPAKAKPAAKVVKKAAPAKKPAATAKKKTVKKKR